MGILELCVLWMLQGCSASPGSLLVARGQPLSLSSLGLTMGSHCPLAATGGGAEAPSPPSSGQLEALSVGSAFLLL